MYPQHSTHNVRESTVCRIHADSSNSDRNVRLDSHSARIFRNFAKTNFSIIFFIFDLALAYTFNIRCVCYYLLCEPQKCFLNKQNQTQQNEPRRLRPAQTFTAEPNVC